MGLHSPQPITTILVAAWFRAAVGTVASWETYSFETVFQTRTGVWYSIILELTWQIYRPNNNGCHSESCRDADLEYWPRTWNDLSYAIIEEINVGCWQYSTNEDNDSFLICKNGAELDFGSFDVQDLKIGCLCNGICVGQHPRIHTHDFRRFEQVLEVEYRDESDEKAEESIDGKSDDLHDRMTVRVWFRTRIKIESEPPREGKSRNNLNRPRGLHNEHIPYHSCL